MIAILLAAALGAAEPAAPAAAAGPDVVVRVSLAGYLPGQPASAVVLSKNPLKGEYRVVDATTGKTLARGALSKNPPGISSKGWGAYRFSAVIPLDMPPLPAGRYRVELPRAGIRSPEFLLSEEVFSSAPDVMLEFMRQQRCGYNPFLDAICHPYDGRTAYGEMPAGTYVDTRGGWHDAGDQLKYLLTSSTATAHLLEAWLANPGVFADRVDALGRPGSNGLADVLDEAKWGLDWLLKLHPSPGVLVHQVADDRDHKGWRLPQSDDADYGWGPGKERTAYVADGKPQGLGKWQSASTGVANLAGRYAAAMALAYRVFKDDPRRADFARTCLAAGREVYAMGKAKEGVQQGNSYGSPYRYAEETWADDMEWGAAEMYRATGEAPFLADAVRYADLAGATSWMGRAEAAHYGLYPFMNFGHFALHGLAGKDVDARLAGYYRDGLEKARAVAAASPFGAGVPFIWCSNNLAAALVTQALLYERMTGDSRYASLASDGLAWLLGRNPWGVSMFTLWPDGAPSPTQPHLPTTNLTGRLVRGGLVDGPVKASIFESLKGVRLTRIDSYAPFQAGEAVYHDDVMDYATNEPTMDGTAAAILMFVLLAPGKSTGGSP
ncbi:MAG TPA: glycoside hydrolase family 9 protein [Thermoanaerobaculia bacterium]|nr:glycoside hydrolase family 9 protein [Thermoanaerobaculia bacterium]